MKHRLYQGYWWFKILLPFIGFLSLLWFLIRVIPKPSRAAYPCQRAAFPLASGFVIWLLGMLGSVSAIRRGRRHLSRHRYILAVACIALSIGSVWTVISLTCDRTALAAGPAPNAPLGVAKGLFPGRVVWVHAPQATNWAGPGDGYWWQAEHTNQAVVDSMMQAAIYRLGGAGKTADAWAAIFRHFNQKRGKGPIGYAAGEKIAIKVNLSTCNKRLGSVNATTYQKTAYLNNIDSSPQMIVALLKQLVQVVGVAQADISVVDTLAYFPGNFWDICHSEFPDVKYVDCQGTAGRIKAIPSGTRQYWSHGGAEAEKPDYLPVSFAQADYIINLSCLKGHGTGITFGAKNHYGSYIRLPDETGYYQLHETLAGSSYEPDPGHYRAMVDIMGHPELGGKTLIHMIDGLYGGYYWQGTAYKFQMAPFNNDWPSSLFISEDPVAIESVGLDFLWEEWPHVVRIPAVDDYLIEAAQAGNPPSGTFYDPGGSGTGLQSLGVYERWNNPVDKKYSRNLGTGEGIELVAVKLPLGDLDGNGAIDHHDLVLLTDNWLWEGDAGSVQVDLWPDGHVDFRDFAVMAGNYSQL